MDLNVNALKYVSISNQQYKIKFEIINIIRNALLFYRDSVLVNKCSGSCNSINEPYAKLCVSDVTNNILILTLNANVEY